MRRFKCELLRTLACHVGFLSFIALDIVTVKLLLLEKSKKSVKSTVLIVRTDIH